jgi:hypothetical protein
MALLGTPTGLDRKAQGREVGRAHPGWWEKRKTSTPTGLDHRVVGLNDARQVDPTPSALRRFTDSTPGIRLVPQSWNKPNPRLCDPAPSAYRRDACGGERREVGLLPFQKRRTSNATACPVPADTPCRRPNAWRGPCFAPSSGRTPGATTGCRHTRGLRGTARRNGVCRNRKFRNRRHAFGRRAGNRLRETPAESAGPMNRFFPMAHRDNPALPRTGSSPARIARQARGLELPASQTLRLPDRSTVPAVDSR